jgi:predicted nucleic acid-binding protein
LSAFFDSSVLVAVFLEDHPHHERSLKAFAAADKKRDYCAAHSLAEVYATVTRLPGRQRVSGEQALLFLENIRERFTFVALTGDEYYATIKEAADIGIVGGTLYDALIARCALKAKVDAVYTWNTRHFEQFGAAIVQRLRTP